MDHPLSRSACKPEVGQEFNIGGKRYVLAGKIGDGAAGLVRRALRKEDGAEFAIKFLAPDPKYIDESTFDDVAARFQREGQRGTQIRHHALVVVHAYSANTNGEAFFNKGPHNPFILMEIVKGSTMEGLIRRETTPRTGERDPKVFALTPERLAIAIDVAEALKYLHQKKLVHRDVKPANIFLPSGAKGLPRAKLGDFGIMKWGDFQASISTGALTMTSQQGLGTLKYMSPEQAISPKDVTVRSDIYSLGITLFELFTGQILPSPHHVFEILNARLSRGTTASRYIAMGYRILPGDEGIAEMILDMHLRGASGRPAIDRVAGRLTYELERRTGE
jgi:serine/threonine-protein kinase